MARALVRWFHRLKEIVFSLGPAFEFLQHHIPPVDRLTAWKLDYLRRRIAAWRPRRVLDFACSTGHVSPLFDDCLYVGADINRSYLRHAAKRHAGRRFLAVEERGLHPFREGGFDLILILCALHHISDETLARVLPELGHALARDGRVLVIEGMDWRVHENWLVRGMLRLDMGTHFRTPEELRALLSRHFDVAEYREENSREDGRGYRLPCFVLTRPRPEAGAACAAPAAQVEASAPSVRPGGLAADGKGRMPAPVAITTPGDSCVA